MAKQKTHAPDLIHTWMETQQSLWKGWVDALQQGTGGSASETWTQGLERWHEAVQHSLEVQREAMQAWAGKLDATEDTPDELKKWAHNGVGLIEQLNGAQQGLWDQWFALMGNASQVSGDNLGAAQVQQFMQNWEQTTKSMQELQRQWLATMGSTVARKE